MPNNIDLRAKAWDLLCETDPQHKCTQVRALWQESQHWQIDTVHRVQRRLSDVGRPVKPILVPPRQLPKRSLKTPAGLLALYHALAHIEFNAVNLALDAVYRFGGMPAQYYRDWWQVAAEEALHFGLLCDCMHTLGGAYGDLAAHNALWAMTLATDYDVMVRMALVPRVLEARGLDVAPALLERLQKVGADQGVAALEIILRDEVGHVAIGNTWFLHLCQERGLEPEATFVALLHRHAAGALQLPFNYPQRLSAGFTLRELRLLEQIADDFKAQWRGRRQKH